MSLNGLDAPAVVEAHQYALADAGGWFTLKYVNRDTVDVLGKGHGGVPEAKGVVAKYEEKSPLFGMVQYRRKRVILKYVPEGTSRLLQVRLTVQFQSILDAFAHETVFTFTAPAELVESALGMCTMLQPAVGGSLMSSDSSMRQRRLNEISEDAEDLAVPIKREEKTPAPVSIDDNLRKMDDSDLSGLPASAIRAKALLAKRKEENELAASLQSVHLPRLDSLPSRPRDLPETTFDHRVPIATEVPRPLTSLSQLRTSDEAILPDLSGHIDDSTSSNIAKRYHHSRHLSENESESISQWNEQVTAYAIPAPKPKKKLGPRPHVDSQTRPKTANLHDDTLAVKPVANLPQSVRISARPRGSSFNRPASQQSTRSVPARFIPTPNLAPPLPDYAQLKSFNRPPGSYKAPSVVSSTMTDVSTASPEKLRLMKALQQRKRNQLLAQRAASAQSTRTESRNDFPLQTQQILHPATASPVPSTIQEEVARASSEVKSLHDSSTASPASEATTSDEPSTRPSSLAEDSSQKSRKSVSLDTDSSSTPKAITDNTRTLSRNQLSVNTEPISDYTRPYNPIRSSFSDKIVVESMTDFSSERAGSHPANHAESSNHLGLGILDSSQDASPELLTARRYTDDASLAVPPSTEASSVLSEDDALIEELQSATLHEAKPMSVVRPPSTPTMRRLSISSRTLSKSTSTSGETPKSSHTISSIGDKSPGPSLRSLSTALPPWPPAQEEPTAVPLTRKPTLGDGISKRIKALEVVTRRDTTTPSTPTAREASLSRGTFGNLMKRTSFIPQFQPPVTVAEKKAPQASSNPPPALSIEKVLRDRALMQLEGSKVEAYPPSPPKPETVAITTRIIRSGDSYVQPHEPSFDSSSVNPQRDRLFVEHERQDSEVSASSTYYGAPLSGLPSPALPSPTLPSSPGSDKKRFSFASHRSGSTLKLMQNESMASRLSVVSNPRKAVRTSPSETSSIQEDKRSSRASRLMKRVSGLGSLGRGFGNRSSNKDHYHQDAIMEHQEASIRRKPTTGSVMQMIDIGDVNVQFPETLLWKRRFLRIDDQGYLLFSAPTDSTAMRGASRKFHIADVQEPCLPDVDREEIAWSVLLDLRDGNCIQCGCESKEAQTQVLSMLLDAHTAYHSLYPSALE